MLFFFHMLWSSPWEHPQTNIKNVQSGGPLAPYLAIQTGWGSNDACYLLQQQFHRSVGGKTWGLRWQGFRHAPRRTLQSTEMEQIHQKLNCIQSRWMCPAELHSSVCSEEDSSIPQMWAKLLIMILQMFAHLAHSSLIRTCLFHLWRKTDYAAY